MTYRIVIDLAPGTKCKWRDRHEGTEFDAVIEEVSGTDYLRIVTREVNSRSVRTFTTFYDNLDFACGCMDLILATEIQRKAE